MAYTTIDDPSAHFQTTIYTGNDTDGTQITNSGNSDLKPDWLWIKNRTDAGDAPATGGIWDSTRGFAQDKVLTSFTSNSEGQNANGFAIATTDGFTVEDGTSGDNPRTATNKNAKNYVAWQWKANGGTTSSNTDGDITSTVQANTTAGFSVVTYTGTGSAGTVGHGLGETPNIVIVKERGNTNSWLVQSNQISSVNFVTFLNRGDTGGEDDSTTFNGTHPTSSVFSVGTHTGTNRSSGTYVAYCFASIKGYSKFGIYEGNNSTDGTFVYTGFKPAFVMVKNIDAAYGWQMLDNKRDPHNVRNQSLFANLTNAEDVTTADETDFLSNGFKNREGGNSANDNYTYLYMAFAEHPFVSSKGVPVTAG